MHTPHPVFGDLVTANRLIRGGRWVFRGTIVLLDEVFADLDAGMSLHDVWEKHGTLERADLQEVAARASRNRATTATVHPEAWRRAS
ncbi:DUF433 domain-containing protein [Aureimonas sp. ME7]|uniref:DUF433 domain-containing protein n=1 Tax=Aureimonas sp. ME7 TaxID=2744252 RepID=UPI0015F635BC|nr:DUF433 domain-containing protein [Aureimonas sp. ME7]